MPQGAYDIPLLLVDKIYKKNGKTLSPATEDDGPFLILDAFKKTPANESNIAYYGDIIHVNGVPWPYLNVEPRKYRFRILDGSTSRYYKISIETSSGTKIPMKVIATGTLAAPLDTLLRLILTFPRCRICGISCQYQYSYLRNCREIRIRP